MDSYTGQTRLGAPAQIRTLTHVRIAKVSCSPLDNNAYVLTCRASGAQLLIDAADSPELLTDLVGPAGLACLVTTHQHFDHHRALAALGDATGACTYAGADDAAAIEQATSRPIDVRLQHGDVVHCGEFALDVIGLRGHTPGSIALAYTDPHTSQVHLFTGDCLFPGGIGNTFGNPDHFASLLADVTERIFQVYPDDTWVYPGHGRDTILGAERALLPTWRQRGW